MNSVITYKKIILKNITLRGVKPAARLVSLKVWRTTEMKPLVLSNGSVVFKPVKKYIIRGLMIHVLNKGDFAVVATSENVRVMLDNKSLTATTATPGIEYVNPGGEGDIAIKLLDFGVVENKDTANLTVKIGGLEWTWQVNLTKYVKTSKSSSSQTP